MTERYGRIVLGVVEDEKLIEEFKSVESDIGGVRTLLDALADLAARNARSKAQAWVKLAKQLGIDRELIERKPLTLNFVTGEVSYEGRLPEGQDD